jgi:GTPase
MHKREDRVRALIERWKDRVRADTGDAAYVDSFYSGGLVIEMMVAELEHALDGE